MVGSQLGSPPRSRPRLRSSTPGPAAREAAFARDPPSPVRGPEFDFTALTPHQLAALQLMRQAARDEERRSPNPPTAEHQVMNHFILKLCCTIACYSYRIHIVYATNVERCFDRYFYALLMLLLILNLYDTF